VYPPPWLSAIGYVSPTQAAERLGVSRTLLPIWRTRGVGPTYVQIGPVRSLQLGGGEGLAPGAPSEDRPRIGRSSLIDLDPVDRQLTACARMRIRR